MYGVSLFDDDWDKSFKIIFIILATQYLCMKIFDITIMDTVKGPIESVVTIKAFDRTIIRDTSHLRITSYFQNIMNNNE